MTHRQARFFLWAALVVLPIGCGDKPVTTTTGENRNTDLPKGNPPPIQKVDPNPPTPEPAPSPQPKTETEDLLKAKPDFTLKVLEVPGRSSFEKADREKFASKYGGKILDVSGELYGHYLAAKTPEGEDCVSLRLMPGVRDFLCRDMPVPKALPGQMITLRGRCDPELGLGLMTLVHVEGKRPPTITAEDLAKACKEGKADNVKVVGDDYLIVTGTILKVQQDDVGSTIFLTPPGVMPEVRCGFGSKATLEALKLGAFKMGQPVQILGRFVGGKTSLNECVVVPPEK